MSTSFRDRAVIVASVAVAAFAIAGRVHGIAAYPAIYDYDASGHAVNVIDLLEGHLSNVRSWCGSHPPLYYALGALLSGVLPERVPMHVALRGLSVAAWIATVALVWRAVRRVGSEADAAVAGTLLLGIPGLVIASSMMTNDVLCAFWVTATLVHLLAVARAPSAGLRTVAVSALLAALAAATKATGLLAVAMTAGFYAWRSRTALSRLVRDLAVVGLVVAVVAGPHYVRLFLSLSGSAYAVVGTRAGSQEKEAIGMFVLAAVTPPARSVGSLIGLFHDALWGDPLGVYLPREGRLESNALRIGGALVAVVAAAGILRLFVLRAIARQWAVVLVFGALYLVALFPLVWQGADIILAKVNYLLLQALPFGLLLVLGLGAARGGGMRTALQVLLLAVATGGTMLTWYGWWEPPRAVAIAARTEPAATPSAARTVERYFEDRARDPIRALRVLSPDLQLRHELRLARILRIPFDPAPGPSPEEERSLELARARVAWLELNNLVRWMQPMAAELRASVVAAQEEGDVAEVRVRVGPRGPAPPREAEVGLWPFPEFEQDFTLRRSAGEWRIEDVRQRGVSSENAVQAFVAYPTLAGLENLRSLGWHPSWEAAVPERPRTEKP